MLRPELLRSLDRAVGVDSFDVTGIKRQIVAVCAALQTVGRPTMDLRAALCFADIDGLPLLARLIIDDVLIDGPSRPQ